MLAAVIIVVLGIAGIALKRGTMWWIPGGLLLAGAGLLTLDAILLPKQDFGAVLRFIEVFGACVSALLGAVLLHAVASFRQRRARLAALGTTKRPLDLPSARVHSAGN